MRTSLTSEPRSAPRGGSPRTRLFAPGLQRWWFFSRRQCESDGSLGSCFGYVETSRLVTDRVLLLRMLQNRNSATGRSGNLPLGSLALEEQPCLLYFPLFWLRRRHGWMATLAGHGMLLDLHRFLHCDQLARRTRAQSARTQDSSLRRAISQPRVVSVAPRYPSKTFGKSR